MQELTLIRRSEVPAYLKSGDLFKSFDDENDDEISVPSDCIKLDTSVSSLSELDHLLSTVRYWIVSPFITELMEYVVDRRVPGVKDVIAKYWHSFPTLFSVVKEIYQTRTKQACNLAAKHGCIELLKYFAERKKPLDMGTLRIAAENGHAVCLSYCFRYLTCRGNIKYINIVDYCKTSDKYKYVKLVCHEVNLDSHDWTNVIIAGHVDCLAFLLKHGVRPNVKYIRFATITSQISCLQCLLKVQPDRSPEHATCAAANDKLDSLKCIVSQPGGYVVSLETWQAAMRFKPDLGIQREATAADSATKSSTDDDALDDSGSPVTYRCLLYLLETVAPQDTSVLTKLACELNNLTVLRLLHQRGVQFNVELVKIAAQKGSLSILQYLHDALHFDCWVPATMAAAAGAGQLQLAQQLNEMGCAWDESAPIAALQADKTDCLRYLIEQRGVPENAAFTNPDIPFWCRMVLIEYKNAESFKRQIEELAQLRADIMEYAAEWKRQLRLCVQAATATERDRAAKGSPPSGQTVWDDWKPSTTGAAGEKSLVELMKTITAPATPLGASKPTTPPGYLTSEEFTIPDDSSLDGALLSVCDAAYNDYAQETDFMMPIILHDEYM